MKIDEIIESIECALSYYIKVGFTRSMSLEYEGHSYVKWRYRYKMYNIISLLLRKLILIIKISAILKCIKLFL
jgi:hypothetical protein